MTEPRRVHLTRNDVLLIVVWVICMVILLVVAL